MADKYWVSTDGNVTTAASWSPANAYASGDSVFFNELSQVDVTAGLSSLGAAEPLAKAWIQKTYEGDIGANGNPWNLTATRLIHNGPGSIYHNSLTAGLASKDYVVIDSPNMQDAYILTGTDGSGGLANTWAILNGAMRVLDNSTSVIGTLLVGPGRRAAPRVEIGAINSCAYFRQAGGTVITKTPLGSNAATNRAILDGGTLIYHKDATGANIWRNLEITGGHMVFNGLTVSGGVHMTECTVTSGILDMTQDSRPKVITTLRLMPGATFLTHSAITVTNLIDLRSSQPVLP